MHAIFGVVLQAIVAGGDLDVDGLVASSQELADAGVRARVTGGDMGRLDGKVAIVTGGASGMGLATVERFVAEGARVVLTDLPAADFDALVDRSARSRPALHYRDREKDGPNDGYAIAERLGDAVRFVPADVTVADDLAAVVDAAVTRASAGSTCCSTTPAWAARRGASSSCPEPVFDRIIDVDLKAVWRGIKLAAPHMVERGGGSIISTSSGAALMGIPGLAAYSAAKGGVVALTRAAAMELAPSRVRVNCICPGGIVTPIIYNSPLMGASIDPDTLRAVLAMAHPIPRAGEPEDIANAALWLASDEVVVRDRAGHRRGRRAVGRGRLPHPRAGRDRATWEDRREVRAHLRDLPPRPRLGDARPTPTTRRSSSASLAEEVGFDHVWAVEHHFLENYSLSSAPDVFLSAVAQRTERIRIGHGVRLLPPPFNHPARSASSAAVLDILSHGRLEFGVGRSITEQELGGFGVDPAASRPMLEEVLPEIVKMWTNHTYPGHEGEHFSMPPRVVQPKPIQAPHPPLWMACTQPSSFELAADFGVRRARVRPRPAGRPRRGRDGLQGARRGSPTAGGAVRERQHRGGGDDVLRGAGGAGPRHGRRRPALVRGQRRGALRALGRPGGARLRVLPPAREGPERCSRRPRCGSASTTACPWSGRPTRCSRASAATRTSASTS